MIEKIRQFVIENYLFGREEGLQNDTSFLEAGIIDSTGILELVTFLESTFGIKVQDDELITDNLDSIDRVCVFVTAKSAANESGSLSKIS